MLTWVWVDMWYKKKKACRSPAITNPASLSSPQCLCLCLPLTVSFSQATLFLRPSISSCLFSPTSVFLVWVFFFFLSFSFSLCCSFYSHACSLCSLTSTKKEARRSCEKSVCRCWIGSGQLSSVFFVSDGIGEGRKVQKPVSS